MPLITEDTDVVDPTGMVAVLEIAGTGGFPLTEATVGGNTAVVRLVVPLDVNGVWSTTLTPNANITPAGTVWKRTLFSQQNNRVSVSYATVGSVAAAWNTLLTPAPGTVVPYGGATVGDLNALDVRVDALEVGGGGAGFYRHVQTVGASVWTVVHNLGHKPGGIFVEDSAHTEWKPRVSHVDINTLTLSFFVNGAPAAFPGEAYIL